MFAWNSAKSETNKNTISLDIPTKSQKKVFFKKMSSIPKSGIFETPQHKRSLSKYPTNLFEEYRHRMAGV